MRVVAISTTMEGLVTHHKRDRNRCVVVATPQKKKNSSAGTDKYTDHVKRDLKFSRRHNGVGYVWHLQHQARIQYNLVIGS